MWFTCQDDTGDLLVVVGMGVYPNLGTAEAFAIVNRRGRHTTVRAHRKLGLNRMDMTVGPLSFEVVTPFREWHLSLGDNDHGIAFDLAWFDTKRPVYRNIGGGSVVGTRSFAGVAGYDGFGRQSGWVEVDGVRHEVTTAHHCGTRDHHWGTRDGVGGRSLWGGCQHPHSGEWVEFAEYGIWGTTSCTTWGTPAWERTLRDRRYRLRFEPDTRLLVAGEVDYVFADGRRARSSSSGWAIRSPSCGAACTAAPTEAPPTATCGRAWRWGTASSPGRPTTSPTPRSGPASADSTSTTPVSSARASGLRHRRALRHPLLRAGPGRPGRVPPAGVTGLDPGGTGRVSG